MTRTFLVLLLAGLYNVIFHKTVIPPDLRRLDLRHPTLASFVPRLNILS
jgi:hypothetical protein